MENFLVDAIKAAVPWYNKVISILDKRSTRKCYLEIWWIYIQYKICKAETLSLHIKEDFPMIKGIIDFKD